MAQCLCWDCVPGTVPCRKYSNKLDSQPFMLSAGKKIHTETTTMHNDFVMLECLKSIKEESVPPQKPVKPLPGVDLVTTDAGSCSKLEDQWGNSGDPEKSASERKSCGGGVS